MTKEQTIKELTIIPEIGKSLATDLWNIGITSIDDLKGKDPEVLFALSNDYAGVVQDRCVLYAFYPHMHNTLVKIVYMIFIKC
ncbi:helix-hairpin-helix domain-containing protein [Hoylesella nanceiensis]